MAETASSAPLVLAVAVESELPWTLRHDDRRVIVVGSAEAALGRLDNGVSAIDGVVSGHDPPALDGLDLLRTVRVDHPDLPFVLTTADGSERLASEAIRSDVTDYVPRDALTAENSDALARRIDRAITDGHRSLDPSEPDPDPDTTPMDDRSAGGTPSPLGGPTRSIGAALRLKERAMDEAPVGITIADGTDPDHPLVYVNDAFERMTGYNRADVLGENTRFLQGERSDPEAIRMMHDALDAEEPISVELINYRKDGTPFWNAVDIAPIRDSEGQVTHYVGFQTDVAERKHAEREAERKAAALVEERATLSRLLERVEGLVQETTGALAAADSRETAERILVDRIADADPYEAAWIGRPDRGAETVTPTVRAGTNTSDADPFMATGTPIDIDDAAVPLSRAIATHCTHIAPDASRAAFPITAHGTLYGVLSVEAAASHEIDDHERPVLDALCNTLAMTIDALESKRVLTAENVAELTFEITSGDLFYTVLSEEADCSLTHAGSVRRDGRLHAFVTTENATPERVERAVAHCSEIESSTLVAAYEGGDACLFDLVLADPSLPVVLADHGATPTRITATAGVCRLRVDLPIDREARSVARALETRYGPVDLVAYHERERPARTASDFFAAVEDRLTDRQLTVLRTAYLSEFFEWPRPVSGDELSQSMDISRSTFHQHLRAAERKLIAVFFER